MCAKRPQGAAKNRIPLLPAGLFGSGCQVLYETGELGAEGEGGDDEGAVVLVLAAGVEEVDVVEGGVGCADE